MSRQCTLCKGQIDQDESHCHNPTCFEKRRELQRDRAHGIIVDAMIVIARAAVVEKQTNDSRRVEEARARVLKEMERLDNP